MPEEKVSGEAKTLTFLGQGWDNKLAALIREAGSERERRLTSVLFVIMSDMPKKRDWLDPDIEREASRLLGEAK